MQNCISKKAKIGGFTWVWKTGIELERFLTIYGICGMTVCGRQHFGIQRGLWSISVKPSSGNEKVLEGLIVKWWSPLL